jgi:hypothetical protein
MSDFVLADRDGPQTSQSATQPGVTFPSANDASKCEINLFQAAETLFISRMI